MARRVQITFDCADPDRLARFWGPALGYVMDPPPEGYASWEDWLRENNFPEEDWNNASAVSDPDGVGPRIYFQKVPEPKQGKNRVHLDVNQGTRSMPLEERTRLVNAEAERLQTLGAQVIKPGSPEDREFFIVMQDPEGNEFCLQ